MTEAEWLGRPYSLPMLDFLRGRARPRKLRLFAAECCRRVEPLLAVGRLEACQTLATAVGADSLPTGFRAASCLEGVAALGRLADEEIDVSGLESEAADAFAVANFAQSAVEAGLASPTVAATRKAVEAVYVALASGGLDGSAVAMLVADAAVADRGDVPAERPALLRAESAWQADLLRDLFGNPFQPPSFDAAWRTETVVALARTLYEERAFERLPVLADALMDAGCSDEAVLGHCRSTGPHARGCWVVDWGLHR